LDDIILSFNGKSENLIQNNLNFPYPSIFSNMAGWEDDDYEVPTTVPLSKGKWEGEDEEDEDIPVTSRLDIAY